MRAPLVLALILGLAPIAAAAPFRPFVDEVGVTRDGLIITTTSVSGQDDPPTARRHAVRIFTAGGIELASVDAEAAAEGGAPIGRRHWRAIDAWLGALGARRLRAAPLIELPCRTHPEPGERACPADPRPLVAMPTGLGRWNVDQADPIWAWGTPRVVAVGATCILLLPDNSGLLDRIEGRAVPCPPVP